MKNCLAALCLLVLALSVSMANASHAVRLRVQDVVCHVDPLHTVGQLPYASATAKHITVTTQDKHLAAKDCSAGWLETEVTCAGPIQFKGLGDCDPPVAASKVVEDCGTVRKTVIQFRSGRKVEIRKHKDHVTVDYDRH